jgi:hypothetical protein
MTTSFLVKLHKELTWGHENPGASWLYFNGLATDPKEFRMCEVVVDSRFPNVPISTHYLGEISPNQLLTQLRSFNFIELSRPRDRIKRFYYHDQVNNQRFRLECNPASFVANPRHYARVLSSQTYEPYNHLEDVDDDTDIEDEDYVSKSSSSSSSEEEEEITVVSEAEWKRPRLVESKPKTKPESNYQMTDVQRSQSLTSYMSLTLDTLTSPDLLQVTHMCKNLLERRGLIL